jgi:hypothetical protein
MQGREREGDPSSSQKLTTAAACAQLHALASLPLS